MSRHHKTFAPRTSWFEIQTLDNEEAEKKYEEISSQDATISLAKNEVTQLTHDLFNNRAFNKIEKNQSVLQFSKEGLHVQILNKALNELGYKTKKNETLFWNETKSQLMNFQRDHGVKASGILDAKTLLKMDEVLVKWGDSKDENSYNNEETFLQVKKEGKENKIIPATSPPDEKVSISVGVVLMKIKSNQEFFEYLDIQIFGRIIDAQWNIGNNSYKDYIGKETTCEVSISSLKKYLGITDAQWEDMYKKNTSGKSNAAELRKSVQKQIKKVKDRIKEMQTLSSAKRQFIKDPTSSIDYIQNTRILDLLEQLSEQEIADYNSKVSQETTDLAIIEASLKAYIAMREKNRKNQEELETVKTKLYGLEELYKEYKEYKSLLSYNKPVYSGQRFSSRKIEDERIARINARNDAAEYKLIESLSKNGFKSISEFENLIKRYETSFETETVRIGVEMLQYYKHTLYKEEKKLNDDAFLTNLLEKIKTSEAKESYKEAADSTPSFYDNKLSAAEREFKTKMEERADSKKTEGNNAIGNLSSITPLVNDPSFDKEEFAEITNKKDLKSFLQNYIISQTQNVDSVINNIQENPEHIYELDKLFQTSYAKQGIKKETIYDSIITAKHEKLSSLKILLGICTAIFALALIVVTWGAATPVVIAGGALSLAVSIDVAYETINEYKDNKEFHDVGLLSDDPSLVWVVLAIAGVALDAGALAAVLKSTKPIALATKAFNEAEDASKALTKLKSDLAKIEGLEARVQQNIVRQAKMQAQQEKILDGFVKARQLTFVTIPGLLQSGELLARAVFAIRKGIVTFDRFIAELKLAKIISETALNPEELVAVKNAFEKARTLAKDDKLALELEKAIGDNDLAKVKSLLEETDSLPSKLIEDQNIYRGSSKEYSLAKKHLDEYITGEIYKIKKMNIPEEAKLELIANLQRKNKAYIEGNIENLRFNKLEVRKSGDQYIGKQIFEAYKIDKVGGINTPNAWLRNADTEYVMLSEIAEKLGAKKGGIYPQIQGEITIVSELPYCMSCQGVIQDFSTMFPNVKINLIDNLKY